MLLFLHVQMYVQIYETCCTYTNTYVHLFLQIYILVEGDQWGASKCCLGLLCLLVGLTEIFHLSLLLHLMPFLALDYCFCSAVDLNTSIFVSALWKHLLRLLNHAGSRVLFRCQKGSRI